MRFCIQNAPGNASEISPEIFHSKFNSLTLKNGRKGRRMVSWLVVEPTHLKNMLVKMGIFPNFRGENKKCLKPPPSFLLGETVTLQGRFLLNFGVVVVVVLVHHP